MLINSSLIERDAERTDIATYKVAANDIANELGNAKVANMVILGALVAATGAVNATSVLQAFEKMFAKRPELLAINRSALTAGAQKI